MRKSEGLSFDGWLWCIARCELWNGRMRTPNGWKILYDLNYSVHEAACCTRTSLELVKK
jgi:hypothetical protein